ncbi:hypothetical protein SAMN05518854_108303 [Variovorax sp. YR266]|uniref:InlB B-repeat-containing protein n=1 Tax=Variovorax sp. YR266 TaxID=1884386 RepID=UPI000896D46F|nr:hypothetical protein [Variovorax sp. YR266]SDZ61509.1 hypothetical protein SAMN05518854_108303 [Variovorax sp. YR266]
MTKKSACRRWMACVWSLALLTACGGGGAGGAGGGLLPPIGFPPPVAVTHRMDVSITGAGRVASQPAGIDCADSCGADFASGTQVTLTATPAAGQVLGSWGGACSSNAGTCTVRVDAALTVTAAFVAAPPVVGWGDAVTLSAAGASLPKVGVDAQGRALVVWRQLEVNSLTDRLWGSLYQPGGGWSTPQRLEANNGAVRDVRVAIDKPSGRAVVVWTQLSSVTGYDLWALQVDPSTGWGTPALLETGTGTVGFASAGIDANGNAVAVWSQIGPATRFSIYANRYTPAGGWGTAALIETDEVVGTVDGDPAVVVAGSGESLAVWKRSTGSSASLWTNRADAGGTWAAAAELVPDAGTAQSIGAHDLAIDAGGNALLAWGQVDLPGGGNQWESAVWFKRFSGGAWQGDTARVGAPFMSTQALLSTPVLRMNAAGATVVSWGRLDNALMAATAAPGAAFGADTVVRPAASQALTSLPALGVDDATNALAAWTQANGAGTGDLYAARHTLAGAWGAQALQESSDEAVQTPDIGMNELGNAVLAWQQFDPAAGTRIYIRQYGSGR